MVLEDKQKHNLVMDEFLTFINRNDTNFILKGGTGWAKCYNSDRFSEDIDLDCEKSNIESEVKRFCKYKNYKFNEKKNSVHGQRFMIDYNCNGQLLKIETRVRGVIPKESVVVINGIKVFELNVIAKMKLNAYVERDKIRDMYDVSFIINNYWDKLKDDTKINFVVAFELKGLSHFEYLSKTQTDDSIDKDKFLDLVLSANEIIENYKKENKLSSVEDTCNIIAEKKFSEGQILDEMRKIYDTNSPNGVKKDLPSAYTEILKSHLKNQ